MVKVRSDRALFSFLRRISLTLGVYLFSLIELLYPGFVLRHAWRPVLYGLLLALTLPPLPLGVLCFIPLALLFQEVSRAQSAHQAASRLWWAIFAMSAVHLSWLMVFLANLMGSPPMGVLAFLLYALEGGFYAGMAWLAFQLSPTPAGRLWTLAGSWVVLEWLRTLGPLAFPWPTLGVALVDTPLIQIADLGGVLLVSLLMTTTAAALVQFWRGRRWPLRVLAGLWLLSITYGLTRTPGQGPERPVLVLRTAFDAFARASGSLSPAQQLQWQVEASRSRQPGEVVVWSETALSSEFRPRQLPGFPGPGISGLGVPYPDPALGDQPRWNAAVSIEADGRVSGLNLKAQLVPFGEYFLFQDSLLKPIYAIFERQLHFEFPQYRAAQELNPLELNGVQYGAYICYDSVFPRVARALTKRGAQLLVNPSNDGWYAGWGVAQHFAMGRVRAIENRRWLVRSVNNGVAGSVDDLGRPVQVLRTPQGPTPRVDTLHVRPKLLTGETLYTRFGDWPVLLLALLLLVYHSKPSTTSLKSSSGSST